MKVAVTGASGLLGGFVVAEVARAHAVVAIDVVARDGHATRVADVLDVEALAQAMDGCEAVIHLAAIDSVRMAPEEVFFGTNTLGTWNVLMVAERLGMRRAVVCSSGAAMGFSRQAPPACLPIPVDHALRPVTAYAMSKQAGEMVAAGFARRGRMSVVVLRPTLVMFPHHVAAWARAAARADGVAVGDGPEPPEALPLLGAYVGPEDAAQAFAAALAADIDGCATFFVTGPDTMRACPTVALVAEAVGQAVPVARPDVYAADARASAFDLEPGRRALGWAPRDRWADLVARYAAG